MSTKIQARAPRTHFAYDRAPHPPYTTTSTSPSYRQYHQYQPNHPHPQFNHTTPSTTNAYMNPTLPQPAQQTSFQTSPRHGIKRSAADPDDELERSTHIATQFKKLRLNNQHHIQDETPIFNPYNSHHEPAAPASASSTNHGATTAIPSNPTTPSHSHSHILTLPSHDFMPIDETPYKIYIPDLDSEIASIEAAERTSSQIFLPDFEKQIGAIPEHVLQSNASVRRAEQAERAGADTRALVLYRDPVSISVPEEEDAVRKAVLEARRGIRERMRRDQQRERETAHVDLGRGRDQDMFKSPTGTVPVGSSRFYRGAEPGNDHDEMMDDGDAMDIE